MAYITSTMPKRRAPTNTDDTAKVDQYLYRVESDARGNKYAEIFKHYESHDAAQLQTATVTDLTKVVRNLSDNDCPEPISAAYLHIMDTYPLPNSVRVYVCIDRSRQFMGDSGMDVEPNFYYPMMQGSEELLTLKGLTEQLSNGMASPLVCVSPTDDEIMDRLDDPITTEDVNDMIDSVVAMGWDEDIFKEDGVGAQRYKDLLTAWIGGSPWGHSFTHAMYRPSMASWDDFLWHKEYIMKNKQCGLLRGLNTSTSLLDISVGPRVEELPKGCVQIWKNVLTKNKKDGTMVNSFVSRTTMDIREAFLKARQGSTTSYCTVVEAWEGEQAGGTKSAKRGATKGAKGRAKKKAKTTTGAKNKRRKTTKATTKKKPVVK